MKLELLDLRDNTVEWCNRNKKGTEKLVILSVGADPASSIYMRNKLIMGTELGIATEHIICKTGAELEQQIKKHNTDSNTTGIIVQLPLLAGMDSHYYINLIHSSKDVDMLTDKNKCKIMLGKTELLPATATSCIQVLENHFKHLDGKDVLLIGRSDLCNNALYFALKNRNATAQHAHSRTKDIAKKCKNNDIIITAAGCPGLITPECISPKVQMILDVSINRVNGKISGDVTEEVYGLTTVTANPRGLGANTVPNLFRNVILMHKMANMK